jgi:hypothetical protein
MNTYTVTFIQYYEYEIDAHDEDTAFDKAYEKFKSEMYRPIARTGYDDVDIECTNYGDEEEDEQW